MSAAPSGLLTASRFTDYTRPPTSLYSRGASFDASKLSSKYIASSTPTRPPYRRTPSTPSKSDSSSESGGSAEDEPTLTPSPTTAFAPSTSVPPSLFNTGRTSSLPRTSFRPTGTSITNVHPSYLPFVSKPATYAPTTTASTALQPSSTPKASSEAFLQYARSMIAQTVGLPVEELTSWSPSELAANFRDVLSAAANRSPLPPARDDSDCALRRTLAATAIGVDPLDNSLSDSFVDDILEAGRTVSESTAAPTSNLLQPMQTETGRHRAAQILGRHTNSLSMSEDGIQDVIDNYQGDTTNTATATIGSTLAWKDQIMSGGLSDPLGDPFLTTQISPPLKTMKKRLARRLDWEESKMNMDHETLRSLYYAHQNVRIGEAGPSRIWPDSESDSDEEAEGQGFVYDEDALDALVIGPEPSPPRTRPSGDMTTSPPSDDRSRSADDEEISAALAYKRREEPDTTIGYISKQPPQRIREWAAKSREPFTVARTSAPAMSYVSDDLPLERRYSVLDAVAEPFAESWSPDAHAWRIPQPMYQSSASNSHSTSENLFPDRRYAQVGKDLDDPFALWTAYQTQQSSGVPVMV